jgi:hypothetical protein
MFTYNFSESIEVCSQVVTDLGSGKEDLLVSQAVSFIEGALLMYAMAEPRCPQLTPTLNQVC